MMNMPNYNKNFNSTPDIDEQTYKLRQEKHKKTCLILRIIGIIILLIGAACSITGFVSFGIAFGTGQPPTLFFMAMLGLPLVGVGLFLIIFSLASKIAKFNKDSSMQARKEQYQEFRPEMKDFVGNFKNVMDKPVGEDCIRCIHCGTLNDAGDKFCKNCGERLPGKMHCPNCGAEIDNDAKFCSKCGKTL